MRTPTLLSLAVGLLILSGVFWLLERWRPSLAGQRRSRVQTRTDLAYWFFTPLVTRFVTRAALGLVFILVAVWQYALLLHANVSWTYGPFRYFVASPAFHRWHHTSEEEGLDTNFAGLFPFIDLAFGTFYMPIGRQPQRFGILNDDVPEGLLGQLAYPFRQRR